MIRLEFSFKIEDERLRYFALKRQKAHNSVDLKFFKSDEYVMRLQLKVHSE